MGKKESSPRTLDQLDLNLLRAFEAVSVERSVSRAAERLGITQPGMSRALARLRTHFDDQLFVRTDGKLVATPLAEALAEPILRALETLRQGLLLGRRFDPLIAARIFKIAMVGYCEALLLPPLFAQVQRQAPGIAFRSVPATPDAGETLRCGDFDLAITSRPLRGALVTQRLLTAPFVVALRRNHPAVRDRHLTLRSYLSLGFVAVDDLPVDTGCARPPAARVHSFLGAAALLVATDLVAVLPEQMASRLAEQLPICMVPPPLDLAEFELKVSWPERLRDEPAHRWLRCRVRDVAESTHHPSKHPRRSNPQCYARSTDITGAHIEYVPPAIYPEAARR